MHVVITNKHHRRVYILNAHQPAHKYVQMKLLQRAVAYQVVLDGGDGDGRLAPLALVDAVAVEPVALGQQQRLAVFFVLDLTKQHSRGMTVGQF